MLFSYPCQSVTIPVGLGREATGDGFLGLAVSIVTWREQKQRPCGLVEAEFPFNHVVSSHLLYLQYLGPGTKQQAKVLFRLGLLAVVGLSTHPAY